MVKKNKDIKLCVFCGSKKGFSSDYYKLANKLGKIIALNKVNLVYQHKVYESSIDEGENTPRGNEMTEMSAKKIN